MKRLPDSLIKIKVPLWARIVGFLRYRYRAYQMAGQRKAEQEKMHYRVMLCDFITLNDVKYPVMYYHLYENTKGRRKVVTNVVVQSYSEEQGWTYNHIVLPWLEGYYTTSQVQEWAKTNGIMV